MLKEVKKTITWNGDELTISTGKIANQTNGSVVVQMGNMFILCTVASSKEPLDNIDFCPVTVNYLEKFYSAGKIPGGFFKTEGKATEKETLVSRLIDRPIRPLIDKKYFHDTQIICTVHSYDSRYSSDVLSIIGASAALAISDIPYTDIAAAARVGYDGENFILNPNKEELKNSTLDLVVSGTEKSIMMVESEANFMKSDTIIEAIEFAHESYKPVIQMIKELQKEVGKTKIQTTETISSKFKTEVNKAIKKDILQLFTLDSKQERENLSETIFAKILEKYQSSDFTPMQIKMVFQEAKASIIRSEILSKKSRLDKRNSTDIRDITTEVGILPSTHGSALFNRGETQTLVSTTLGTTMDQQIIGDLSGEYKEKFLLNYVFPGYSVGEPSPLRAPTRREVGHGKLAWKALKNTLMLYDKNFPYTVRVVSEVTSCNGSSSMATICGASMSMMHAGVPMKSPIAGIAMGLIAEKNKNIILSDIIAEEDYIGDMDFKVAGNQDGITALQMDIKITGISIELMKEAMSQAEEGLLHILDKMHSTISSTNDLQKDAGTLQSIKIDKNKIKDVIGPGGRVIKEISATTQTKIDASDDGTICIIGDNEENVKEAVALVKNLTMSFKVGDIVNCSIHKVLSNGIIVQLSMNQDGFIHISEISEEHVESPADVCSEGDIVTAKIISYDKGKMKLTIKNVNNEITPYNKGNSSSRSSGTYKKFNKFDRSSSNGGNRRQNNNYHEEGGRVNNFEQNDSYQKQHMIKRKKRFHSNEYNNNTEYAPEERKKYFK